MVFVNWVYPPCGLFLVPHVLIHRALSISALSMAPKRRVPYFTSEYHFAGLFYLELKLLPQAYYVPTTGIIFSK